LITTSLLVVSVPDTVALPVKLGDAIGAKSVLMLVLLIANCSSVDAGGGEISSRVVTGYR
jgi:hypothetical protein